MFADNYGLWSRPLVFVIGKGGVGKTTVAVALARACAARGATALVCAFAPAHALLSDVESIVVEPEPALREWLSRHLGRHAAALVLRSPAFSYFVAAAPGAAELVMVGKAIDLARAGKHDCVIVDAPATGHALAMLGAPRTFASLAPLGPVAHEAAELGRRLADPAQTAYVGVTAPEELAVAELFDLERDLPEVVGRGLDLVVVNGVHPDRFSDEVAQRLQTAGLDAVLAEHRLARRQAERVAEVRRGAQAPVVTLAFEFPPADPSRSHTRAAAGAAGVDAGAGRRPTRSGARRGSPATAPVRPPTPR